MPSPTVALLTEGVDRNTAILSHILHLRRAWIEIGGSRTGVYGSMVALREEGVGRNSSNKKCPTWQIMSPSSRRAWVEIT